MSIRALKLEFELEDDRAEALVEELVEVQQVAAREGKVVVWLGQSQPVAAAEAPAEAVSWSGSRVT